MLLLVAGCTGTSSKSGDTVDAQAADAAEEGLPSFSPMLPTDFHCDPTLDSIRDGIFVQACSFFTCHGDPDAAWGLNLTYDTQKLQDEVVGKPAASCPGWSLVVPGDPSASFLFNKLSERPPACGEPMPRGGMQLPQVALDCVRGWIAGLPK
jgi:hypothetical protein